VRPLEAATYQRHAIHGDSRLWPETNCYTDLLIEMVHGFGYDPVAMLPCTLGIDFEGDQWTFFKPSHADLYLFYGIDIQELLIWRPVVDHLVEMVERGHPVMVELDSYYLPDTAGTAYKLVRTKSTVGVNEIDVERRFMGYFHNRSYHELRDDDFRDVLMLEGLAHERMLPPFSEFWKWRSDYTPPRGPALVDASLESLKRNLTRIPEGNPFERFRERFARSTSSGCSRPTSSASTRTRSPRCGNMARASSSPRPTCDGSRRAALRAWMPLPTISASYPRRRRRCSSSSRARWPARSPWTSRRWARWASAGRMAWERSKRGSVERCGRRLAARVHARGGHFDTRPTLDGKPSVA
jgi:hypothetical protein